MKKSILIFFACVILYTLASAQQVNQDIVPASTGLNIGHSNQRWNGFFRNVDISGTCTFNNGPCFGGGGVQLAGNNTWTGTNIFKSLNNIQFADQFAGANCGAKISAADIALGGTAGEIWVNQNCGSPIAAVSISANHVLRFIQGGTYTVSGTIMLAGTSAGIAGVGGSMTSGATTGPVTILKEANGANLPAVVKMTGGGNWMEAVAVDGNKANQTCPSPPCYGIWNFKTGRPALRNVSVQNAFNEGIMIESSATPTNESCCGDIIDVMSLNNGGSAGKILNTSDTKITHTEFEASNIGLELIDSPNTRIVNSDFGGNTLQGLKSTCAAQFGASGVVLSNSQFGNNGNADDLFIDAWNGAAQCLSGTGNVITGNQFIGSGTRTANTYDAIKIQNSKFNTVTGNNVNTGGSLFKIAVEFLSPSTTEGRDELSGNQLEGWGTTSCTLAAATNSVGNSLCANQLQNSVTVGFAGGSGSSGKVTLEGQTNGETSITVPNIAGTSHSMQLPIDNGTSGQVLSTDGASPAQLSWVTSSGAPKQALPASPLINQGASTPPVYAAGITYVSKTAQDWSQTGITTSLTGCPTGVACATQTLTLNAGFSGIDVTSGVGYQVYITDGSNSEAVNVTGGTYTLGAGGTITFVPFFNHGPGAYTVGSASSGIQETLNAACGTDSRANFNAFCNVTLPATGSPVITAYNVKGTIFWHSNESILSGYGAVLICTGRAACLQIGDRSSSNHFANNTIEGLSFRSPTDFSANPSYAGVQITNTVRTTQVVTITTATAHGFRPGDMVTILFTDQVSYWGDAVVTSVPTATSFTYAHSGGDIASLATPGVVALAYSAILDNGGNSHLNDLTYDSNGEAGHFNNFFDMWDDENATITKFNNNAINLFTGPNWTGSFIFSAGNQGSLNQIAPVITFRDSNLTANSSNGVTVYNSNGLYIDNVIIQASGPWQVYSSNTTGNFQGAALKNIYSESTLNANGYPFISGSVTSGVFVIGEKVVQATTLASAYLRNAPTGVQNMAMTAVVGTPNNTNTWTGQTSAAVYTPTTVPAGWKSPFYGTGIAGLIAGQSTGAASFSVTGSGGVQGATPTGGTGATAITYWIVANDVTTGTQTSPMRILDWVSTGADLIPVTWPRVANGADTITYDVIRSATPVGVGGVFPYNGGCGGGAGTTCGSVATAISQATACSGTLLCVFQDSASVSTSAYTVKQGTYAAGIIFWPGSIVSTQSTVSVDLEQSPSTAIGLNGNPIQNAKRCSGGAATAGGFTTCAASGTTSGGINQAATLMTDGGPAGGGMSLSKGKLNFNTAPGTVIEPHHIITLIDSQPGLTRSTNAFRPAAATTDCFIGTDVAPAGVVLTSGQMSIGCAVSISHYIGATGDGTTQNWLERLTSSLKVLNVNLQIAANKAIDLVEGTAPGGVLGHDFIWGDSTAHRPMMNPNNAGAFNIPGIATAGTAGHLAAFATNGIDLVDGGAAGSGTVTSSGPPSAGQAAVFSTAINIVGNTDFLYTSTPQHFVTVPAGAGTTAGLQFSGQSGSGIAAGTTGINVWPKNTAASDGAVNVSFYNGTSYVNNFQVKTTSLGTLINSIGANIPVGVGAAFTSTGTSVGALSLGNTSTFTATSGVQTDVHVGSDSISGTVFGANFAPTSGTAEFRTFALNPIINQTGGANGLIRVLAAHPLNTALVGTEYCLSAGTASSGGSNATLTDKFTVECTTGNTVSQGSLTATTSVKGATYLTATNCAAVGTAANPSVVSCSSAAAGLFYCDVAASAGTCTLNTTAITGTGSQVFVRLTGQVPPASGVTCNTAPTAVPAIYEASWSAGTATINMPTGTVNGFCFEYEVKN